MIYESSKAVDVYPRKLFGISYDVGSAFKAPVEGAIVSLEGAVTAILSSRPEILGHTIKLVEREHDVGTGVIDLLFRDGDGTNVVVEVKETADQETVGQVLKQARGFQDRLGLTQVRRVIVALRTAGNVGAACKDAGIELYILSTSRVA